MKNLKFTLIVIIGLLLMVPAAFAESLGVEGEFSLDFPSTWERGPQNDDAGSLFAATDMNVIDLGKRRDCRISKFPMSPAALEKNISSLTDDVIVELRKNDLVQGEPVKEMGVINGHLWGRASYEMLIDGLKVKNIQFLAKQNEDFYSVTFIAVNDDFYVTDPIFEKIMASFKFDQ